MKSEKKRKFKPSHWAALPFLLSGISLAAVGFSTWLITGGRVSTSDNLSINVAGIEQKDVFTSFSCSSFTLCPDGVLIDETISSTAQITINLTIDNSACSSYGFLDSNDTFTMSASLKDTKETGFLACVTDMSANIEGTTKEKQTSESNNRVIYKISFKMDRTAESTSLTLTYSLGGVDFSSYYTNKPNIIFGAEATIV